MTRATAGDRAAEAELCRRFAPAARTFARRRLRGADAVEEFAQDVLLRLVQALREGAVDDPPRVGGFVLGICRNLSRERARTQERRTALWEQFGGVVEVMDDGAPARSPQEVAHLEDCLSQMTERTRMVLRRVVVEGASAAEVATQLSLTEGNVRVMRHRGLEALRKCMQGRLTWQAAS
ncbi:MAG TPA: sigma-70 family RNA polymerase sigma factor [Kofleriaceae bacterium]|nr:sigma-70 family RNA polymerase sigma factor [Kofleriaceae bacterium]